MKKIILMLMSVITAFSLIGCKNNEDMPDASPDTTIVIPADLALTGFMHYDKEIPVTPEMNEKIIAFMSEVNTKANHEVELAVEVFAELQFSDGSILVFGDNDSNLIEYYNANQEVRSIISVPTEFRKYVDSVVADFENSASSGK